jgi:hypothetical protein
MQSTDARKQYRLTKEMASTASQREATHASLIVAVAEGVMLVIGVLLFLASMVYVVFGGSYEVAAAPEAKTSIRAVAAASADASGERPSERASGSYAQPADHLYTSYVNRGRDGNVVTYKHD